MKTGPNEDVWEYFPEVLEGKQELPSRITEGNNILAETSQARPEDVPMADRHYLGFLWSFDTCGLRPPRRINGPPF